MELVSLTIVALVSIFFSLADVKFLSSSPPFPSFFFRGIILGEKERY